MYQVPITKNINIVIGVRYGNSKTPFNTSVLLFSPCEDMYCPEFATCVDESTDEDPFAECRCQFGRVKINKKCVFPTRPPPTERPNPTLEVTTYNITKTFVMFSFLLDLDA